MKQNSTMRLSKVLVKIRQIRYSTIQVKALLILTLFLTMLFLGTLSAEAASFYCVRAGATGANNGTDWNNAYTSLPASLVRGATYYIADGSYSGYTFDDTVSGTTLITIKKATASDHGTETGWSSAYGDGQATFTGQLYFNTQYISFDGQTGGGPGSWNSGHGFVVTFEAGEGTSSMVIMNAGNNTISHVFFDNVYNSTHCSRAISGYDATAPNVTIRYCYFKDLLGSAVTIDYNSDGWLFEYTLFADLYSSTSDPSCHGNYIATKGADNLTVRYSLIQDCVGTSCISAMNGGTGPDESDPVLAENWYIYGNIFTSTFEAGRNLIYLNHIDPLQRQAAKNWKIYNNTFADLRSYAGLNGVWLVVMENGLTGNEFYNNILYNVETPVQIQIPHDYSWSYGSGTITESNLQTGSGNIFVNTATKDYRLTAPTSAGMVLSSPYNVDPYGNIRGSNGTWTRGAIDISSTKSSRPSAPSNLVIN